MKLTNVQIKLIKQKIDFNGNFIVRLNVAGNKDMSLYDSNHNVYYVTDKYEVLWQIEVKPTGFERDSFTYIEIIDGNLIAKKFFGFKYKVDINTGKTEMIGWDK